MVSILPGTGFSAISRNQSSSLGAFWRYKRLSGDRFPTGGTQVDIRYDYIFESKRQYTSLKTDTKNYMQISSRWIGFLGTHVRNYDTTQIESYNLFTMGGYGSLRGFREDEFRSRRLAWANAEIQYMLDLNSMFYGFYDHGLTEIEPNKLKMDNFGIGIGVKLGTKLGIMSIEYGLGYRDNRFSDIGLGMIHMGLDVAI
jgi:outer membrane protein assembly factor BamA